VQAGIAGEKFTRSLSIMHLLYDRRPNGSTSIGQRRPTSWRRSQRLGKPEPYGRAAATSTELYFVERVSLDSQANIRKARRRYRGVEVQEKRLGFSFVEILSTCPTNWGYSPVKALDWLRENMIPYYPLGNLKCPGEVK